jgi:multicomponent Na+:H+ antiporter subunit C
MFEDGSILNELFLERLNYLIYVVLLLIGLHAMISKNNFIKKLIGMSIFQTAIILFYVSIGVKEGATIPIYLPEHDPHGEQAYAVGGPEALTVEQVASYSNPLPHVLMLTAIVVGVATLGLALALCQKIYQGYATVEENELMTKLEKEDADNRKSPIRAGGKPSTKPKASSRVKVSSKGSTGKSTASQAKKAAGTRKTKAPVKKTSVKKAPIKKTPVKKTAVKKAPVKKTPVKKTARKSSPKKGSSK